MTQAHDIGFGAVARASTDVLPRNDETERARELVRARMFGEPLLRVGRYELGDRIGAGAMGTVYRARDPALHRDVAIKLLGANAMHAGRLRREAQGLARLAHPNVVEVFEVGTHDGEPFIVMALV